MMVRHYARKVALGKLKRFEGNWMRRLALPAITFIELQAEEAFLVANLLVYSWHLLQRFMLYSCFLLYQSNNPSG